MHKRAILSVMFVAFFASCSTRQSETRNSEGAQIASGLGWLEQYENGQRILTQLSALTAEEAKVLPVDSYRGEKVTLGGGGAPPGSTNDLITPDGYYVRVVNVENKDLRPQAVAWSVIVLGEIRQVLPHNRIIVIDVDEKNYQVLEAL